VEERLWWSVAGEWVPTCHQCAHPSNVEAQNKRLARDRGPAFMPVYVECADCRSSEKEGISADVDDASAVRVRCVGM